MNEREARLTLDTATGVLRIALPGVADSAVINTALHRVFGEEGAGGLRRRLWDARGVTDHQSLSAILDSAGLIRELMGDLASVGRTAVLVDDDVAFGVVRQYMSVLPDGYPMKVFRSEPEAMAWLTA